MLPEQLRGQPEEVVRFTLNKMVESLSATNERNRTLEQELRKYKAPGSAQPQRMETEQPKEPPKPPKPLDEWILEDPEAALDHFVKTKYGSVFDSLNQVNERVARTEYDVVRQQLEDFSEYEQEITEILESSGTPKTRENIMGAYVMAVGNRTLTERQRARRAANNPEPAAQSNEPPKKEYQKSELSEQIRQGLGLSEEDYYEKYANPSSLEIKVPR